LIVNEMFSKADRCRAKLDSLQKTAFGISKSLDRSKDLAAKNEARLKEIERVGRELHEKKPATPSEDRYISSKMIDLSIKKKELQSKLLTYKNRIALLNSKLSKQTEKIVDKSKECEKSIE